MFGELGAVVIDADEIARQVTESPQIRDKLRRHWGKDFLDASGSPDRARIARRAFGDPDKLRELTGWVHPPTLEEMRRRLDEAFRARKARVVVIDAPLLLEAELDRWCDAVVFVEADFARRAARVKKSRGWRDEEIERREASQVSIEKKRRGAHAVVDNNGSMEETLAQVKRLFRRWSGSLQPNKP